MTTAPRKRIVYSAGGYRHRTRLGIMRASVLECGHMTDTNATDRRRGRMYCWDCYYGKPQDPMGAVILAELAAPRASGNGLVTTPQNLA